MAFFFSVENHCEHHKEQSAPVKNCIQSLGRLFIVILSISTLLFFYVMYIVMFARSLESSNPSSLIISILPTAVLAITGWYVQRQLHLKRTDSLTHRADNTNLQSSTGTVYHSM